MMVNLWFSQCVQFSRKFASYSITFFGLVPCVLNVIVRSYEPMLKLERENELYSLKPVFFFFAFSNCIAPKWFVLNTIFDFSKGCRLVYDFLFPVHFWELRLDYVIKKLLLSVSVCPFLCVSLCISVCLFFLFCFGNPTVLQEFSKLIANSWHSFEKCLLHPGEFHYI